MIILSKFDNQRLRGAQGVQSIKCVKCVGQCIIKQSTGVIGRNKARRYKFQAWDV